MEYVGAGERGDHRIGRAAQKFCRSGELHQPAVLDHPDAPGQGACILEGVGHEQGGELELGENVGEPVAHLLARDRVECAERLVKQQHAGLARESAR